MEGGKDAAKKRNKDYLIIRPIHARYEDKKEQ